MKLNWNMQMMVQGRGGGWKNFLLWGRSYTHLDCVIVQFTTLLTINYYLFCAEVGISCIKLSLIQLPRFLTGYD